MKNSFELIAWLLAIPVSIYLYIALVKFFKREVIRQILTWLPILLIVGIFVWEMHFSGNAPLKAAPIRVLIGQIEMYNAAVNTFRTRYNGLPGDHASITNYFSSEQYPDFKNGDGDKLLSGAESIDFWKHLKAAELVHLNLLGEGIVQARYFHDNNFIKKWFSESAGIVVYASGERNYYQIARYETEGDIKVLPALTPEEAFNLDSKMVDGRPFTGSVTIRSAAQDGSSRLDGDITQAEVGYEAGNEYACVHESDISTDAKKRAATYAIANENLACSIRIRMN